MVTQRRQALGVTWSLPQRGLRLHPRSTRHRPISEREERSMTRSASRKLLSGVVAVGLTLLARPARAQVVDDFESYALGALPSPLWSDAGAVLPQGRIPSFPSAYVISTLNAHGNATQAVTTVG